jgi:hypothetical protein
VAVAAGTSLGPYEITAPLGAGGMGEVYRARDTRLGRDVAVKVLPSTFSADPDRLQRFEQEAYFVPGNQIMAVAVTPGETFESRAPSPLFRIDPDKFNSSGEMGSNYDVTADGQRFLVVLGSADQSHPSGSSITGRRT